MSISLRTSAVVAATGVFFFLSGFSFANTYVITTNADALSPPPAGSLRAAITSANTNPGPDSITFNIGGGGARSIALVAALPGITQTVTLDATTQPGFSGTPLIELNGTSAGGASNGLFLFNAASSGSVIRGFILNRFGAAGVFVLSSNANVIANNWIGLNNLGTGVSANGAASPCILLSNSGNNTIGGSTIAERNVLCGGRYGIAIWDPNSTFNTVTGNWIGLLANGSAGTGPSFDCINIYSGAHHNTIGGTAADSGNVLSNAARWGIGIGEAAFPLAGSNVVQGNRIGTNADGTLDFGNAGIGVYIAGCSNNLIGGPSSAARNIISGNNASGIYLDAGAASNTIQSNTIGLNAAGTTAIPNSASGIELHSGNQVIGGAGAGNVISGNKFFGISIPDSTADGTTIQGNIIGLDAAGNLPVPNRKTGIETLNASSLLIGGTEPGQGNVVSGNLEKGVVLVGPTSDGNLVQGNIIGLDKTGMLDRGNGLDGLLIISGSGNNTVGGATAGARNIISGNNMRGIAMNDAGTGPNRILNNFIGTDITGAGLVGNTMSGVIVGSRVDVTIGGTEPGEGNVIAGNNEGIMVLDPTFHKALGNSIHDNWALGIDISWSGVTVNDSDDSDGKQNFPMLFSVHSEGTETSIKGRLVSSASTSVRLEFFSSPAADPSGYGEGATFIGTITVTTNGSGLGDFSAVLPVPVASGHFVTATATSTARGTSEFSKAVPVPFDMFVVTNTNDSGSGSLRQCIENANAIPGADTITFNIPPGGAQTIAPLSQLPDMLETLSIDGTTQPGFSGNPIIELTGVSAGAGVNGLTVIGANSCGSSIRGLIINRWGRTGINLTNTSSTLIAGNWVGVSRDGLSSAPNHMSWANIWVSNSPLNVIGGTTPSDRNVVCAGRYGIALWYPATTTNTVSGNWLGLLPDGLTPAGPTYECISVFSGSHHNIIGGTVPGSGNVISAALRWGIQLGDAGSPGGNVVQGNLIGTDPAGKLDFGNGALGIYIWQTPDNIIGGASPEAGNIISGTKGSGILTSGSLAVRNLVQGNYIGLDVDGMPLPNSTYGVLVDDARQQIGGTDAGQANWIAFNGQAGVCARNTTDVLILGNSIHDNGGLGIDVGPAGVTANDAGDTDMFQNRAVVTGVHSEDLITTVFGTLSTFPSAACRLEFFRSPSADPSGFGEGRTLVGVANVVVDGTGSALFTQVLDSATSTSEYITVTATTPRKGTSEFSNAVPANSPPLGVEDAWSTDEDTVLTVAPPGVLANDTDVDGTSPTLVAGTPPARGNLTLNANGSFVYVPDPDFNGAVYFTYFAADQFDLSSETTVTITVNPVNDRPVAGANTYSTLEDTPLNVPAPGVLINDHDIDSTLLSAVLNSTPSLGVVTLQPDGSFQYVPNLNQFGVDQFTYIASDGDLESEVTTVTITVTAQNDPPVAVPDVYATNEDVPLVILSPGVLANDYDVDSPGLTVNLTSVPSLGMVTLMPDGSFTYVPNPDTTGTDVFTYRVSDGIIQAAPMTVTIVIGEVNDAPVAAMDFYVTTESTTLLIPAPGVLENDTDVDGHPISAMLDSMPVDGDLVLNADGSFSYTPTPGFSGFEFFTYHANDGISDSEETFVIIQVRSVKDAPIAVQDFYSTNEDTPLVVYAPGVLANDTDLDLDTLSAVLVSATSNGSVTLNSDGSFAYVPQTNFNGTDVFLYLANDGTTNSQVSQVSITVHPANDSPATINDAYSTAKGEELTIPVPGILANDSDADNDPLTAGLVNGPSHGMLNLNQDGSFTYTPAADFTGIDSFTYLASDGTAESSLATVSIAVDVPSGEADLAVRVLPRSLCSSFDILVTNAGPGEASDVLLVAQFNGTMPQGVVPSQGAVMTSGSETVTVWLSTIAPGAAATVRFDVFSNAGGAMVMLSADAAQSDANTSDNTATVLIDDVLAPSPTDTQSTIDLAGSWTRNSGVLKKGRFGGALRVSSILSGRVGQVSVAFYLSNDATFDCSDVLIDVRTARKIKATSPTAAGARKVRPLPSVLRRLSLEGKYLIAVIDTGNQIPEPNESNNVVSTIQLHGKTR